MPYNTDPNDVRAMIGGFPTADISDSQINEESEAARDIIDLRTGRTWSSGDAQFELIVRIEDILASALILAYGGPDSKTESERLWTRAMQLLETVVNSQLAGVTGSGIFFSSSAYKSYPLGLDEDPNTEPYRSTWISKRRGVSFY